MKKDIIDVDGKEVKDFKEEPETNETPETPAEESKETKKEKGKVKAFLGKMIKSKPAKILGAIGLVLAGAGGATLVMKAGNKSDSLDAIDQLNAMLPESNSAPEIKLTPVDVGGETVEMTEF